MYVRVRAFTATPCVGDGVLEEKRKEKRGERIREGRETALVRPISGYWYFRKGYWTNRGKQSRGRRWERREVVGRRALICCKRNRRSALLLTSPDRLTDWHRPMPFSSKLNAHSNCYAVPLGDQRNKQTITTTSYSTVQYIIVSTLDRA